MHDFLKAVKLASLEAVNSSQPSTPLVGNVISTLPLSIRVNQRLILSEANLMIMEAASGIVTNDKVALIKFAGGQQYLVLGKLK